MSLPERPEKHEPDPRSGFGAKTAMLSLATLLSRLLGLVREQLFALTLGASAQAEAFVIAYRIPNLLRDLFAEGALSAAFIPAYSRADTENAERGFALARRLITLLCLVLTLLCGLGIVAAPLIVSGIASGFASFEGKSELAVSLTRIMMPILPLVSFAAVAMGMLNSRDRFGLPSLAPAFFNVVNIAVALGLHLKGLEKDQVAYGWAVGAVVGSAAQLLVQWPGLRGEGFRYRPDFNFKDPLIRDILTTMAPATIALAAVQINIFISSDFASTQPGAVAWLGYAFRLLYLPMGLFGVAVGTIAGARLSRLIASGNPDDAHTQMGQALRLLLFLTLPSAIGLILAGRPIVRLIYEHGAFTATDTFAVARALAWMSLGLVAYASTKVFVPYFYAIGRPRVPFAASLLAVTANLLTLSLLFESMGFESAGLGMALGNLANGGLLLAVYRGPQPLLRMIDGRFLASLAAGLTGMSVVVWWSISRFDATSPGLWAKAWSALFPVVLGGVAYVGLAAILRVPEATRLVELVRRHTRR